MRIGIVGYSGIVPSLTSYSNLYGKGDRNAAGVSVASGGPSWFSPYLVAVHDGDESAGAMPYPIASVAGFHIQIGLPVSGKFIDEITFFLETASSWGTYQFQGSDNGASWTNIGSQFELKGVLASAGLYKYVATAINGNTVPYQYYRIQGVSGSFVGYESMFEIEYKISA